MGGRGLKDERFTNLIAFSLLKRGKYLRDVKNSELPSGCRETLSEKKRFKFVFKFVLTINNQRVDN